MTVVVKENAFAKLATKLLERELHIQERADPALAAKRVLKGTPLEDLAEPRKRARGQRSSGECLLASFLPRTMFQFLCDGLSPVYFTASKAY